MVNLKKKFDRTFSFEDKLRIGSWSGNLIGNLIGVLFHYFVAFRLRAVITKAFMVTGLDWWIILVMSILAVNALLDYLAKKSWSITWERVNGGLDADLLALVRWPSILDVYNAVKQLWITIKKPSRKEDEEP